MTVTYEIRTDSGRIAVYGDGDTIIFEVPSRRPGDAVFGDFAVWALLPIAMAKGRDLHIVGVGDSLLCENAAKISCVWETWLPRSFRRLSVTFESYEPSPPNSTSQDLVFYSGGIDSTHNLLTRAREGKRQSLLTIQGMDYKDDQRFAALLRKTETFANINSHERLAIKTNLPSVYKKYGLSGGITHGFSLAASAFLFSRLFVRAEIAADYTRAQEYLVHPWGTNSLTNQFFASNAFHLNTAHLELGRTEKVGLIAESDLALGSVSFCKDDTFRPENCGRCSKCVRTKAMFLVSVGYIPGIFIDSGFDFDLFNQLNLNKKTERAFLLDLWLSARTRGTVNLVPGLRNMASDLFGVGD
jgi:hypothetical protein